MSRIQSQKAKLIMAVAALGFVTTVSVSKANALDNSNYKGRYACTAQEEILPSAISGLNPATAIYKIGPNGAGAYNPGGVLVAAVEAFATVTTPGTGDFCFYSIDPAASSYHLGSDGFGFEDISWVASATNPTGCPGSFEDQTAVGIRNDLNADGATIRTDFADVDLLGSTEAGYGHCLK